MFRRTLADKIAFSRTCFKFGRGFKERPERGQLSQVISMCVVFSLSRLSIRVFINRGVETRTSSGTGNHCLNTLRSRSCFNNWVIVMYTHLQYSQGPRYNTSTHISVIHVCRNHTQLVLGLDMAQNAGFFMKMKDGSCVNTRRPTSN